ncbi:MAG: hypothetical protein ABIA04_07760 [Pseudomonadota bacterium]
MLGIKASLGSDKKGDPLLFCDLLGRKRALLFDLGNNRFTTSQLRRVTDIFISHTHIDHFIGFEKYLRLNIIEAHTVNVYGPPGITKNVRGKLDGYCWNITEKLFLKIKVWEVLKKKIKTTTFDANSGFKIIKTETIDFDGETLLDDKMIKVKFARMDHRTTCFSYLLEEKQYFNVKKDVLEQMNILPQAWLGLLKEMAAQGNYENKSIEIEGVKYKAKALIEELFIRKEGFRLGYITDIAFSAENIKEALRIFKDVHHLYCESFFLDEDREKAKFAYHLTAKQSGQLATMLGAKKLIPFHISKRYLNVNKIIKEIKKEFKNVY